MLDGEHLAGTAHATLHLIDHEQDASLFGELTQFLEVAGRWHDVPTFTLDRFDNHDSRIRRWSNTLHDFFDHTDAAEFACLRFETKGAPVAVSIWYVNHTLKHGREPFAVLRL